jgi:AraC-like DNA-binding protein
MSKRPIATEILRKTEQPFTAEAVFDCLSDVVFFIKDTAGRYAAVNQTLVERCGLRVKEQIIGHTPSEFQGALLGMSSEAQDTRVLTSGQAITKQLELHRYPNRNVGWCLTTKLPLFDNNKVIVGLVGVSQDLRLPDMTSADYEQVAAAVGYAEKNIAAAPTVRKLADVASMSPYRLDRRMQRVFGLTTGQWMLKLRLDIARQQLIETDLAIATVALNVGYSDQSAFTRQFCRATGLSPSKFRRAPREPQASAKDRRKIATGF